MGNIIEQIHEDHKHWARLLAIIDAEIAKLMAEEKTNFSILANAMRYMTYYPDIVHHPKEDALFDRLKLRDPSAKDIIDHVRHEHLALAEKSRKFFNALKQVDNDDFVPKH